MGTQFPGENPVSVNLKLLTFVFTGKNPTTVSLKEEVPSTPTSVKQKEPGSRMSPSFSIPSSSTDQAFNASEGNTPEVTTPEYKPPSIKKSNTLLASIDKSKLISPDEVNCCQLPKTYEIIQNTNTLS